jgi:mannonate dehydratase
MSDQTNRRDFIKVAAAGAVALGAASGDTQGKASAADNQSKRKTKIRIGARFNGDWLHSKNDDDLRFFKQIGVDYVDIELGLIPGYEEHGVFSKAAFHEFVNRLDAVGLKIERANSLGPFYLNAQMNRPEGQKEIDNVKRTAEIVAAYEIPVFGIQACQASLHVDNSRGGWGRQQGRGGYGYPSFDIERAKAKAPKPKYKTTAADLWKGLVNIYKQTMPLVEGSKTVIAMHGNDPPLYDYLGNPQIICRFADFDRLFEEVPSEHNGVTFCVGTRYESGEDILEGIRRFGKQNKLFHVHFRNVRGTLPNGGYSEVFVDDGDMNMGEVLRTLDEVGYSGVIDYDHPMRITGDEPLPKQYIAFAVGYMRGLLNNL